MSSPQWTPEQLAAITMRGQILVSAAAGSGKTAVLVERLIRYITDPDKAVDVDRFLVVTFTKAAANEMKERVGKALDKALFLEHDNGKIERLLRQRTLLQKANITTLHSFCLELIRKYFYQLELDPAFRVADQAEADLLRQDVMEEYFETRYAQEDPEFLKLVDAFGSDRDDQSLMDYVLRLYEFAYSQAEPERWLNKLAEAYQWPDIQTMMKSAWGQAIRQGISDQVLQSRDLLQRAEEIARSPDGPAIYVETLHHDLERILNLTSALKEGNWSQVETKFQAAVNYPKLPAVRSSKNSPNARSAEFQKLQEECKKLRDETKKKLRSLNDEIFAYSPQRQIEDLRAMGVMAQTLGNLVIEFSRRYAQAKAHRNILDFTDLEHFTLRLLEKKGKESLITQKLKEYFTEIMVDEYQDINPVQERILELISRQDTSPNLFMVGDVKQSIYRFRMADPSLFLAKYSSLPHWSPDLSDHPTHQENPAYLNTVIDLNRNFRSRREVIEGVNFLFRQIMTPSTGEISYNDQAALQYGAAFVSEQDQIHTAEGPIEVHLIDPKGIKNSLAVNREEDPDIIHGEDSPEPEAENFSGTEETIAQENLVKTRIEAHLVSERIQSMVQGPEFQIYDRELQNFRPIRYSDIVILMRSYSAVAPIYVEEFQKAGIPVYAETTTGYFGNSEIETMLSLLKIIDNPHSDIPLAAVLRSPLVGLNGSELGKLRLMLPEGDFYEALTLAVWAGNIDNSFDSQQISQFKQILNLYEESLPQRLEKAQELLNSSKGLKGKLTEFWFKLKTWRTKSRQIPLADLLWSLYEETGYLAYVGTLPSGLQRQANLRVLYDRAKHFEETRYRGLFRFLRFLDRFQGQGKDIGNARILGENENVVRLITVHASKGLEFPVVFVVGLGRKFNTQSLKGKMLLHSQLGLGMPIIDSDNKVRYPSLIQYAVKQRLAQESLAEELRILYVALTRAKERLLLYGNLDNFPNTLQKWQQSSEGNENTLPDSQLRSAKSFLDWIGPALARHPQHFFSEFYPSAKSSGLSIPEINSRWKIFFHQNLIDLKAQKALTEKKTENIPEITIEKIIEKSTNTWFTEVNRRLSWQYPYFNSVRQTTKTSVSELKRQYCWYTTEDALPFPFSSIKTKMKRPKFLQSSAHSLSPAEKGTALHKTMQHIPFKEWAKLWTSLTLQEQFNQVTEFSGILEQREILSAEQKASLQPMSIVNFLNSSLGQRLFRAKQLLRELPFTLTFPFENQAQILVQGIIDVVILSENEHQITNAEILDYKTDSFFHDLTDPEEVLRKRYALQLSLYALAVQRLLKLNVSQCTLYSFTLGREIILSTDLYQNIQFPNFPFKISRS